MNRIELNRRDFNKLTIAAFGGVVAGTAIGCGKGDDEAADATGTDNGTDGGSVAAADNALLSEPHVCRGLNACDGKGKGGENDCAGTSACYTAEKHSCGGQNACKGQGGCGDTIGQNACSEQGDCAVPLMDKATWDKARTALQAALEKQGKTLGNPEVMGPPAG